MADRQQVFVAYPGRDAALAAGIMDAVRKANALPLPVIYAPWEFNDVAGQQLVSPILGKIDESPFVIADITYLNPNVVYEIGFTIGKCKRAFLIRHLDTPAVDQGSLTKHDVASDATRDDHYEEIERLPECWPQS